MSWMPAAVPDALGLGVVQGQFARYGDGQSGYPRLVAGRVGVPELDGGGDGVHQGVEVGGEQVLGPAAL